MLHLNPATHDWEVCDHFLTPPDDEPGWFVAHLFDDINGKTWAVWVRRECCDCGASIVVNKQGFWRCMHEVPGDDGFVHGRCEAGTGLKPKPPHL